MILMDQPKKIRNLSIVAHVDHGKSTLADRLIELGGVKERHVVEQQLDNLQVERDRGITIKAQTVRLEYNGVIYNIIDTPGHVDFSYEVGRSLAACEGVILVVDATQGIEAQTMAHIYSAIEKDLTILPVLNKVDLPTADVEGVRKELANIIDVDEIACISAKTGLGVKDLFATIERVIPGPIGDVSEPLKALLIDSRYDNYHGVVMLVRIIDGEVKAGDEILMKFTNKKYKVTQVGCFLPKQTPAGKLSSGEVGYILSGLKDAKECHVGDTVTHAHKQCADSLPGFKKSSPVVYCGIFPSDSGELDNLRFALEKLNINDSSFTFEPERSILGMGFRCGFLGILHLEVTQQRLEEEFDQEILLTIPSVSYQINLTDNSSKIISNPADFPDANFIRETYEPWIEAMIFTPHEYVGSVMDLCISKRGVMKSQDVASERTVLTYEMPLGEIIFDFHDQLKLRTKGYASFDHKVIPDRVENLVKLRLLINGNEEPSLSSIVHKDKAYVHGKQVCETLKDHIPRQNIMVKIQAAIGAKIIASESISAYRKDVIAKCYGGHVERKKKLLSKQKKGKAKMQRTGNVEIPNSAYIAVMQPLKGK